MPHLLKLLALAAIVAAPMLAAQDAPGAGGPAQTPHWWPQPPRKAVPVQRKAAPEVASIEWSARSAETLVRARSTSKPIVLCFVADDSKSAFAHDDWKMVADLVVLVRVRTSEPESAATSDAKSDNWQLHCSFLSPTPCKTYNVEPGTDCAVVCDSEGNEYFRTTSVHSASACSKLLDRLPELVSKVRKRLAEENLRALQLLEQGKRRDAMKRWSRVVRENYHGYIESDEAVKGLESLFKQGTSEATAAAKAGDLQALKALGVEFANSPIAATINRLVDKMSGPEREEAF